MDGTDNASHQSENMSTAQRILVADDSLTIRKLVETVLRQEGYEVTAVQTGADCISLAPALKPDLILLDYILPDMQGTEICRSLVNSPDTWEIPVLMMSSNGNAIRQLYQDLNNVADYLTKPFAPSVLKAVVGHLLNKEKTEEVSETSSPAAAATPAPAAPTAPSAPAAEPVVPQEFMDKIGRLLHLMEGNPNAQQSTPGAATASTNPEAGAGSVPSTTRKAPKKRSRKPVASAPPSDAILRTFRLTLQKHLRARTAQIPEWESLRGNDGAEEFFLKRLLTKDVLWDLSADLLRAAGVPTDAPDAMRCPASLVPLDSVLRHLHANRVTGELRVQTGDETILACLEGGEVVFLTTNHPSSYCVGAACDFQAIPPDAIAEAVRAQEEQSQPFFLTLQDSGHLPAGVVLSELLHAQGEKCLIRAFRAPESITSFFPVAKLPAMVRTNKLSIPLNQLLLGCYRTVDDWFTLERVFPDMDATVVPTPELASQIADLKLAPDESRLMGLVRGRHTVQELAEAIQLPTFEVCRLLFRFVKLGLVCQGPPRHKEDEDVQASSEDSSSSRSTPVLETGSPTAASSAPSVAPDKSETAIAVALDLPSSDAGLLEFSSPITPDSGVMENVAAENQAPLIAAAVAVPETPESAAVTASDLPHPEAVLPESASPIPSEGGSVDKAVAETQALQTHSHSTDDGSLATLALVLDEAIAAKEPKSDSTQPVSPTNAAQPSQDPTNAGPEPDRLAA